MARKQPSHRRNHFRATLVGQQKRQAVQQALRITLQKPWQSLDPARDSPAPRPPASSIGRWLPADGQARSCVRARHRAARVPDSTEYFRSRQNRRASTAMRPNVSRNEASNALVSGTVSFASAVMVPRLNSSGKLIRPQGFQHRRQFAKPGRNNAASGRIGVFDACAHNSTEWYELRAAAHPRPHPQVAAASAESP